MKNKLWFYIAGVFFLGGCNASKITTSWKAKEFEYKQFTKVLVVGLMNNKDREVKEKMENHLSGDLNTIGYPSITSLQEYGPKAFDSLTEVKVLEKIKGAGIDAVLTIVLLDKQKERDYVPERIYYTRDFWDYYGVRYKRIEEPGYYVTNTKYFWESNLYDMRTKKLIYSVQTESFSPDNTNLLAHDYGRMIVKDMIKKGVLVELNPLQD